MKTKKQKHTGACGLVGGNTSWCTCSPTYCAECWSDPCKCEKGPYECKPCNLKGMTAEQKQGHSSCVESLSQPESSTPISIAECKSCDDQAGHGGCHNRFCALHVAAPDLVLVLKSIASAIEFNPKVSLGWIKHTAMQAIAKTEGK